MMVFIVVLHANSLFSLSVPGIRTNLSPALCPSSVVPGAVSKKSKPQPMKALHTLSRDLKHKVFSSSSKNQPIKFYSRDEPYYEFTNFYFKPIQLDGHHWPTTEHYFQAQKFVGTPYYDLIRRLTTAREAFQVSRNPTASPWIRGDWERVKDQVMLKALRAKFSQDEILKKHLLDTNGRELVEHTFNDSYWGDGGDGTGRNMLGKLLMQVRSELRAVEKDSTHMSVSSGRLRRSSSFSNLNIASSKCHLSSPPSPSSSSSSSPSTLYDSRNSWMLSASQTGKVDPTLSHRTSHLASPMLSRKKTCSLPPTDYSTSRDARNSKYTRYTHASTVAPVSSFYSSSSSFAGRGYSFGSSSKAPVSAVVKHSRASPSHYSSGSNTSIPHHPNASSVPYNILSGK